jgi:hypothetical protein
MLVEAREPRTVARNDVGVKLDAQVATWAKMVSSAKGITLAEYISEILRPIVYRDLQATTAEQLGAGVEQKPPRKPKGGKT